MVDRKICSFINRTLSPNQVMLIYRCGCYAAAEGRLRVCADI